MERYLKVIGGAKVSCKPNMIKLDFNVEGVFQNYEETIEQSALKTKALKDAIVEVGFPREALKTEDFRVDTKYEYFRNSDKKKFLGYSFSHEMSLTFDMDAILLNQILSALSKLGLDAEFNISYLVKDSNEVKKELLATAVADAKEKAKVLSAAANVSLGEIISVDYHWEDFVFRTGNLARCIMSDSKYSLDIEPKDITVEDTVVVVWAIS